MRNSRVACNGSKTEVERAQLPAPTVVGAGTKTFGDKMEWPDSG